MGIPVRIADMARDIIKLSGYKPDEIEIKYVGLRPGEKLYEELITEGESIKETERRDIMVLNSRNNMSMDDLDSHINRLIEYARTENTEEIKKELNKIVPEYNHQPAP
jgi:FlaA1/EpsC-like NDP-sugar epimerase